MSVVRFIADLHLGHENMAKKRGFSSAEEHDEHVIKMWNSVVHKRVICNATLSLRIKFCGYILFVLFFPPHKFKKKYYHLQYPKFHHFQRVLFGSV